MPEKINLKKEGEASKTDTEAPKLYRELGPANQYEKTAADGLITAYKCSSLSLIKESMKLAELIREIDYNHDDFYKVINQSQKVGKLTQLAKETGGEKVDIVGSRHRESSAKKKEKHMYAHKAEAERQAEFSSIKVDKAWTQDVLQKVKTEGGKYVYVRQIKFLEDRESRKETDFPEELMDLLKKYYDEDWSYSGTAVPNNWEEEREYLLKQSIRLDKLPSKVQLYTWYHENYQVLDKEEVKIARCVTADFETEETARNFFAQKPTHEFLSDKDEDVIALEECYGH